MGGRFGSEPRSSTALEALATDFYLLREVLVLELNGVESPRTQALQ